MLQGPLGHCPNCDPREDLEDRDPCVAPFHLLPEFGMVIKGRLGRVGPSPYAALANQAMAQMRGFLSEFGMTPASRSRIPKEQAPERPRRTPGADQPSEAPVDPRDVLKMNVQASKN